MQWGLCQWVNMFRLTDSAQSLSLPNIHDAGNRELMIKLFFNFVFLSIKLHVSVSCSPKHFVNQSNQNVKNEKTNMKLQIKAHFKLIPLQSPFLSPQHPVLLSCRGTTSRAHFAEGDHGRRVCRRDYTLCDQSFTPVFTAMRSEMMMCVSVSFSLPPPWQITAWQLMAASTAPPDSQPSSQAGRQSAIVL